MEYYRWWLGVQEGRFRPGETLAFAWHPSREAALAAMKEKQTGGLAYWFSSDDKSSDEAKTLQNDVLQDRLVRHFGNQLQAWKLDRTKHPDAFAAPKLTSTPAVVVYDRSGKVKKVLQGRITAKALGSALRSVARDRRVPKD